MEETLQNLLQSKIETIVPKGQTMITVPATDTVQQSLKILLKYNIYSAPVFDSTSKKYFGFINLVDIVTAIISSVEAMITSSQKLEDLMSNANNLQIQKTAADLATLNPIYFIGKNDSLSTALKLMASTGTRRLLIVENPQETPIEAEKILNVLTQSSIISYLSKNLEQVGSLGKKTIKESNLGIKNVITVNEDSEAIEAFKLMSKNRITGVAVVHSNGTLFTIISAKDIKEVDLTPPFKKLFVSATQFVSSVRAHTLKEFVPAVYVRSENTIAEVIHKLAFLKLHRLFIINNERMCIGVVSASTIIHLFSTLSR